MVADCFFIFNDTATTEIYTLSLHDALPISGIGISSRSAGPFSRSPASCSARAGGTTNRRAAASRGLLRACCSFLALSIRSRSEEHTSELQSRQYLVCRLLLEKQKKLNIVSR